MAAAFYQRRPTAIRVNPLRTTDEALTQTLQQEGHTGRLENCASIQSSRLRRSSTV